MQFMKFIFDNIYWARGWLNQPTCTTATRYVSAKAHAALYRLMEADAILTDEEKQYFLRGRNAKSHTGAKNTDIVSYRISTGVEALFGYLYLSEQTARIEQLAAWCIEQVESGRTKINAI